MNCVHVTKWMVRHYKPSHAYWRLKIHNTVNVLSTCYSKGLYYNTSYISAVSHTEHKLNYYIVNTIILHPPESRRIGREQYWSPVNWLSTDQSQAIWWMKRLLWRKIKGDTRLHTFTPFCAQVYNSIAYTIILNILFKWTNVDLVRKVCKL